MTSAPSTTMTEMLSISILAVAAGLAELDEGHGPEQLPTAGDPAPSPSSRLAELAEPASYE